MAGPSQGSKLLTLDEFLERPEEEPSLEYIDGRIEAKVSPRMKHGVLAVRLTQHLNQFAEPRRLGLAIVELRCTFAGRSIVPDVVFLLEEHIVTDDRGEFVDEVERPPDLHVEILSPDQSVRKSRDKLIHATTNGCPIGWLIDPEKKTIDVYEEGGPPQRLAPDGMLTGDPVLPGYRLPVAEVFGWLLWRRSGPNVPPSSGVDPA